MSSRAQAGVLTWLTRGGGETLTAGARFVLFLLAEKSEDLGDAFTCEVSEEWLAAITGGGVSTVRRHLVALVDEQVISREREQERDGKWSVYRTSLSLEKLGVEAIHRSNRAVASGLVDKPVEKPVSTTAQSTAQSTAQIEQPPLILSGTKEVLPSFHPKYSWAREDHEGPALRILSVCGPGLADPRKDLRVLASLAGLIESWLASFDLELDIVPEISRRTARARKPGKAVWDFGIFTEDLWAARTARLMRKAEPAAQAMPTMPEGLPRDEKAARDLTQTICALEGGARPEVLLSGEDRPQPGEDMEAAFQRLLVRLRRRRDALLGRELEEAG